LCGLVNFQGWRGTASEPKALDTRHRSGVSDSAPGVPFWLQEPEFTENDARRAPAGSGAARSLTLPPNRLEQGFRRVQYEGLQDVVRAFQKKQAHHDHPGA
jgi:hypothetical protein